MKTTRILEVEDVGKLGALRIVIIPPKGLEVDANGEVTHNLRELKITYGMHSGEVKNNLDEKVFVNQIQYITMGKLIALYDLTKTVKEYLEIGKTSVSAKVVKVAKEQIETDKIGISSAIEPLIKELEYNNLEREIDRALDAQDFELVKELSKQLEVLT